MMHLSWKHAVFCLMMIGVCGVGCGSDEKSDGSMSGSIPVTGISLPSSVSVQSGDVLELRGCGVLLTDILNMQSKTDASRSYNLGISTTAENTFGVAIPDDFVSGTYALTLKREDKTLFLGNMTINVAPSIQDVPDKEGMNLKGMVYCDGKGVEGVVVSDGYETTQTDEKGIYYLASAKKNGYVFISVPSNYEVECQNLNEPQFFKHLTQGVGVTEQHDFALHKVDNTHHKLFVMTDSHLANRNDDLKQFDNFVEDINQTIASESADGVRTYGVDLGDLSWDLYWYSNDFALTQCMAQMNRVNCMVFHLPGNHDNDPYKNNDWDAEQPYKDVVCPTYYSFNLGKAHYVMLDNVKYINTGAYEGHVGDRNYDGLIVADQLEWLKKDLSYVTDKSAPLVVAMHINLYSNPGVSNEEQTNRISLSSGNELKQILAEFSNVQVLTGHTHINFSVEEGNWMEHNVAAVCATWWWTGKDGYAGNHICKDGSPGGYAVWDINGTQTEWYYKGTGYDRNRQFRTYDLNETQITASKYAPNATDEQLASYVGGYANKRSDNHVLINVWNYDEHWKVEVFENGRQLSVKRVSAKDPLHLISYEALRLNKGSSPTESFLTTTTGHMFEVEASSPTSTLEIKVTDRFGNVYSETMTRPKALTYDMN